MGGARSVVGKGRLAEEVESGSVRSVRTAGQSALEAGGSARVGPGRVHQGPLAARGSMGNNVKVISKGYRY